MIPVRGFAIPITAESGNSRITIDPESSAGLSEWVFNGTNYMFQRSFWVRGFIGGEVNDINAEISFDEMQLMVAENTAPNEIHLSYGKVLPGTGIFLDADLFFTLIENGGQSSTLFERIELSAQLPSCLGCTGGAANIRVFEFTDLDLNGSFINNFAQSQSPTVVTQGFGNIFSTETSGVVPTQFALSPNDDILNSLSDADPTNLNALPSFMRLDNSDVHYAFQYNFDDISGGRTVEFITVTRLDVVPEPSTYILFGIGTVTLMLNRPKRKA